MIDEKMVKRSQMKKEDLGLKIIDDRGWIMRQACHGDPARTFWIRGRPLPICSRCIAFYPSIFMGVGFGILLLAFIEIAPWLALTIFSLLIAPLVMDGWTQFIGWRSSNNGLRAVTGTLAGAGAGFGITYMVIRLFF